MKITIQGHKIYVDRNSKNEYPRIGITIAVLLLYMAPFVSRWLALVSFAVCLCRVFRYNARVFATDYCFLLPLASLTRAPGMPMLLIYLCLIAGIWHVLRSGLRANTSLVFLIILMNYLLTRMQMDINNFVLCFGQMFVLCVLLPKQDEASVERSVKTFLTSLIISSVYALLLRNTYQLQALIGAESYAIWGTGIMRFRGLFEDPNYYMTLLIIGLALLIKLRECGMVNKSRFLLQGVALSVFGVLTYSKTFFLVFVLLGGTYVVWQFWSRKLISGLGMTVIAVIALCVMIFWEKSPFAVVLQRLLVSNNISDLTTGRTEVYLSYWKEITENLQSFFFGKGLAAEGLRKDPHNIYLETMYYTGAVGLSLIAGIYCSLVREMKQQAPRVREQHFIERNVVLFMFLLLFFSLHGIFQIVVYGELFLAMLSLMIIKKPEEAVLPSYAGVEEMAE